MTTIAVISACIALVVVLGAVRGKPGRGVADTALLVILLGLLALADFILSRFVDTGEVAQWVAIALAGGLAIDAIYGWLAPERQKQRDRKLRRLMRRRA